MPASNSDRGPYSPLWRLTFWMIVTVLVLLSAPPPFRCPDSGAIQFLTNALMVPAGALVIGAIFNVIALLLSRLPLGKYVYQAFKVIELGSFGEAHRRRKVVEILHEEDDRSRARVASTTARFSGFGGVGAIVEMEGSALRMLLRAGSLEERLPDVTGLRALPNHLEARFKDGSHLRLARIEGIQHEGGAAAIVGGHWRATIEDNGRIVQDGREIGWALGTGEDAADRRENAAPSADDIQNEARSKLAAIVFPGTKRAFILQVVAIIVVSVLLGFVGSSIYNGVARTSTCTGVPDASAPIDIGIGAAPAAAKTTAPTAGGATPVTNSGTGVSKASKGEAVLRYVMTSRASVRSAPAKEAPELAIVIINTPCEVLANAGAYVQVRCDGKEGFVAVDQLSAEKQDAEHGNGVKAEKPTDEQVVASKLSALFGNDATGDVQAVVAAQLQRPHAEAELRYVMTSRASVRSAPAKDAPELALVVINTSCEVLANAGTYAQVRCDGKEGFVAVDQLSTEKQDPDQLLNAARTATTPREALKLAARSSFLKQSPEADAVAHESFFLAEIKDLNSVRQKKKKPVDTESRVACAAESDVAGCLSAAIASLQPADTWLRLFIRGSDFSAAALVGAQLEVRSGHFDRADGELVATVEIVTSSEPMTMQDILGRGPPTLELPAPIACDPLVGPCPTTGVLPHAKAFRRNASILGVPIILGSLDKETVMRITGEHEGQIRHCYEQELTKTPGIAGKIRMKWIINKEGKVAQVQVEESQMQNSNVEDCLVARIKTWVFPSPKGGGVVIVNWPFEFADARIP